MTKEYKANCIFGGWDTGKYDEQGRPILSQEEPKKSHYKTTSVDTNKENADFFLISVGSKPIINWKGGKIERLKSRKALEKLQKIHTWAPDF